jgi:SAM-dependent methyltransferase
VAELARENMKAWGLESRVAIEACDVRNYQTESLFDLVTLHQNIYYFPVRERAALTRQLGKFLKPGGLLVLTTACQGGSPAVEALNVWASNTDGYGPLPVPQELAGQLREAGFSDVKSRRLIPFESFYVFFARRPAQDQAD